MRKQRVNPIKTCLHCPILINKFLDQKQATLLPHSMCFVCMLYGEVQAYLFHFCFLIELRLTGAHQHSWHGQSSSKKEKKKSLQYHSALKSPSKPVAEAVWFSQWTVVYRCFQLIIPIISISYSIHIKQTGAVNSLLIVQLVSYWLMCRFAAFLGCIWLLSEYGWVLGCWLGKKLKTYENDILDCESLWCRCFKILSIL